MVCLPFCFTQCFLSYLFFIASLPVNSEVFVCCIALVSMSGNVPETQQMGNTYLLDEGAND